MLLRYYLVILKIKIKELLKIPIEKREILLITKKKDVKSVFKKKIKKNL